MLQTELRKLATESPVFNHVFMSWALRIRSRENGDFRRILSRLVKEDKIKVTAEDLESLLKRLEKLGIGKLTYGVRGSPLSYHWNYSYRSVALAALEGKELNKLKQRRNRLKNLPRAEILNTGAVTEPGVWEVIVKKQGLTVNIKNDSGNPISTEDASGVADLFKRLAIGG